MQRADRLERLLADRPGKCCEADIEERRETLARRAAEAERVAATDVDALATLGDETRYRLAHVLAAADRELCVCELEVVVDVSDSAVSHALADLLDADLVTRRKHGTWRYYEATERARALLAALDATREAVA